MQCIQSPTSGIAAARFAPVAVVAVTAAAVVDVTIPPNKSALVKSPVAFNAPAVLLKNNHLFHF